MKSILFYVTLLTLFSLMIVIILNNQQRIPSKALTVHTFHSYLYHEDMTMELSFYINDAKHALHHANAYERMFIANEDESKKLELNLQSIQVGQMESYLNESFQKMTWIVDMPFLENDYKLEDGFIHLELINLESYVFFIGDMHLIYPKDASNDLNWIGLHGTKKENSFLSRLDAIFVEMDAIAVEIEAVLIGIEHAVTFEISGETLVLRIPYENALLFNVPIIIRYQHQGNVKTQYIENFKYVVDYQILKESGPIIYAYALN